MTTIGAILMGLGLIITSIGLGLSGLAGIMNKGENSTKKVASPPLGYVLLAGSLVLLAGGISVLVFTL